MIRRALLAALLIATVALAAPWPGDAQVVDVIDGDTIAVKLSTGQRVNVRIVGIDTPELARRGKPAQPGAEAAKARLTELIGGKTVRLEYDALSNREDKYGRQLCYVELDGRDIGLQLLREGHAKVMMRYAFTRFGAYAS